MKYFIFLITILFLGMARTADAQKITILVDNWPPYNFKKDNEIVGINTELIEAALKRTHIKYKLVMYPFKRAMKTVQKYPNTMLLSVALIPQRKAHYAWIGPMQARRVYLFKLKERTDIQIKDKQDLKKYRTGVQLGGSIEQFFIANNIHTDHYSLVSNSESLLKMLFKKRVDLIPGDPLETAYQLKNMGHDFSELEAAYLVSEEGGYYMVANKDTSASIISSIQESLDEVLASGAKEQLIEKYFK
ncbi:transporter substrate-binding domain-containing protein [Maridesulfovibrio sp.]|jgi:polar amino acid transport system substrate-binding protein|uniref:substrate-binding periplasmic protein n=1 Tax=Maridesulfovibrio sp. TaxID=2795000 RepID=UPI0029CA8492|nr:transporter substrate-binding domain-containing protein [Maridesulfovibrio sp.]